MTAKHHQSSGGAPRTPEFSRIVTLDDLAHGPVTLAYSANEAERAALARRFGLVAVGRLEVRVTITPAGEAVLLDGEVEGAVTQACVVTLEPIDSTIASRLSVRYISPDAFAAEVGGEDEEEALGAESEDIEPLPEHGIDVGEVAAQYLALSLEAYPRKEGVALERFQGGDRRWRRAS